MASDGATVMLQCKAGLPVKQKLMFPNITAWHCLNHRLELGAVDAVRYRNETNHSTAFTYKPQLEQQVMRDKILDKLA